VKAVAEDETEVLSIPIAYVDTWMKYPEWIRFMSDMQTQRFTELLEALELTAFSNLDEQLWSYLVKRVQATGSNTLRSTHQEIAAELASPREVITRLLHQLRQRGRVQLSRNAIVVNVAG
jgi:CRP/FNR family transcriptional regulator